MSELSTAAYAGPLDGSEYWPFAQGSAWKKRAVGHMPVKLLVVDGTTRIKALDASDLGVVSQSFGIDANTLRIDPQATLGLTYRAGFNPWFALARCSNGTASVLAGANQCSFTGSITGTVLTVTAVASGALAVGQTLNTFDIGLQTATISSLGTGTGGVGTYNLDYLAGQTIASRALTTGVVINNPMALELLQDGPILRWFSRAPNIWSVSL